MRKKLIVGNWKMNKTPSEAGKLASELLTGLDNFTGEVEVVICPAYPALVGVRDIIKNTLIKLGAQDFHWENPGAFTGKVAGEMLLDAGVTYVIIGHSEQRAYFHETNHTVNKKVKKGLELGLVPIICIGETISEREDGSMHKVIENQLVEGLNGVSENDMKKCVIAYEPVWAIGTGKTATPAQAEEMHGYIRNKLASIYNSEVANGVPILYGGSMKSENAYDLLSRQDVDGGLIGGASLEAIGFINIIQAGDSS